MQSLVADRDAVHAILYDTSFATRALQALHDEVCIRKILPELSPISPLRKQWTELRRLELQYEQTVSAATPEAKYTANADGDSIALSDGIRRTFRNTCRHLREHPADADLLFSAWDTSAISRSKRKGARDSGNGANQDVLTDADASVTVKPDISSQLADAAPVPAVISEDVTQFCSLLQKRLDHILSAGTAPQWRRRVLELTAQRDEVKAKDEVLRQELRQQQQEYATTLGSITEKNEQLVDELRRATLQIEANKASIDTDWETRTRLLEEEHSGRMAALQEQISGLESQRESAATIHLAEEDGLRKKYRQLEKQIEAKIKLYDEEMARFTDRLGMITHLHQDEKARFQELASKLQNLSADRVTYEETVEKPRALAVLVQSRKEEAAAVLQQTFQKFLAARESLQPNSKAKKGKKDGSAGARKPGSAKPTIPALPVGSVTADSGRAASTARSTSRSTSAASKAATPAPRAPTASGTAGAATGGTRPPSTSRASARAGTSAGDADTSAPALPLDSAPASRLSGASQRPVASAARR